MGRERFPIVALVVCVLILMAVPYAGAEDDGASPPPVPVVLPASVQSVETASRSSELLADAPRSVSVVPGSEIFERMVRTVPDSLRATEGVLVQRSYLGGGSPVIRGLTGNHVLYLVDGIRLNNSAYGSGPNQYLNTVDPYFVNQIEVVRGPGSVLYGSDALGGVVNVLTKRRTDFHDPFGMDGRLMGRFATADSERTAHASTDMNIGQSVGIAAAGNTRSFGDIDPGGKDQTTQAPNGYAQDDASANIDFHITPKVQWQFSGQLMNQNQVHAFDKVNPKNEFDPQERRLAYSKLIFTDLSDFLDRAEVWGSFQRQTEGRKTITAANPTFELRDLDTVDTIGAGVQLEMPAGKWARFILGSEYYQDTVSSERELGDLVTDDVADLDPRYPDGATYSTAATYLEARFTLLPWMRLVPGVRYTYVQPDITLDDPTLGEVTVDDPISDVTWAFHTHWDAGNGHGFVLGASRGFRAPNMTDLAVLGTNGGTFDIPNSELDPETMIQYEAGYRVVRRRAFFSLFGYYSQVDDLIARERSEYNGQADVNGVPVTQNENVGEATIYGAEASTKLTVLADILALGGTATYTYGQDEADDEPLSMIPPLMGNGWIKIGGDPAWFETAMEAAAKQDRLSPADKLDPRIGDGGTPAYLIWHFRGGVTVNNWIEGIVGVENAFDRKFKTHGSGPLEEGRNFKTQVSFKF